MSVLQIIVNVECMHRPPVLKISGNKVNIYCNHSPSPHHNPKPELCTSFILSRFSHQHQTSITQSFSS